MQVGGAGVEQQVHQRNHDQRAERHVGHAQAALRLRFRRAYALERGAAEVEPEQADQHAGAGGDEDDLVGRHGVAAEHLLRQDLGEDRRQEGAHVDAHVEDGEAAVAARVGGAVELADHGRDVRLEHAVADDDGGQAELEDALVGNRNHEQAGGHEAGADQDRALVADDAVGDVAAEQGAGVHQREVGTVGQVGEGLAGGVAAVELGDDVEHQGPANAVEREALPEFGHEQHPQRARVSHDLLELGKDRFPVRRSSTAHAVSPEKFL